MAELTEEERNLRDFRRMLQILEAADITLHNKDQGALWRVLNRLNWAPAAGLVASQGDINIVLGVLATLRAQLAESLAIQQNLVKALASVAGGQPFDQDKLLAGVQLAAETGVQAAIESIKTTSTTTIQIKPEAPSE